MKIFKLLPALFAAALMGCTLTVSSPMLGSGGLISVGGGTPPVVTPPVVTPPVVTPPVVTPPAVTPPAVADYFPADPGNALFPSPDNTITRVLNCKIAGKPYELDRQGAIWSFKSGPDGKLLCNTAGNGAVMTVNGASSGNLYYVTAIEVVAGQAYFQTDDGFWRIFERDDAVDSGTYVRTPPAPAPPGTGSATPTGPAVSPASDPVPRSPAPGSTGTIIHASAGGLKDAVATASAGATIQAAPGTYSESVAISVPLLLDGGGKVINPGTPGATYAPGAVLDATSVASYAQGQGGLVPLTDTIIRGWEVRGFGMTAAGHDGTGGIRNNSGGVFRIEDDYIHGNQMGVGPHGGDQTVWYVKNVIANDNGLPFDSGYAHDFYFEGTSVVIEGGVTAMVNPGKGGGHALKSRAQKLSIAGTNYFYAYESSAIDISDGTATPVIVGPGTTIEHKAGDLNRVLVGYGAESTGNGNAGMSFTGDTFIVPNDGQLYFFLTSGPITLTSCKFLYTDGTPVKTGTITVQGGGNVVGLP